MSKDLLSFVLYCLFIFTVKQSYLAQKSLDIQLQRLGVFTSTESISMFAEDYGNFRTSMSFCIAYYLNCV